MRGAADIRTHTHALTFLLSTTTTARVPCVLWMALASCTAGPAVQRTLIPAVCQCLSPDSPTAPFLAPIPAASRVCGVRRALEWDMCLLLLLLMLLLVLLPLELLLLLVVVVVLLQHCHSRGSYIHSTGCGGI